MKRILYTLLLVVGIPAGFIACLYLMVALERTAQKSLGPPPDWLKAIVVIGLILVCVLKAWKKAGQWTNRK